MAAAATRRIGRIPIATWYFQATATQATLFCMVNDPPRRHCIYPTGVERLMANSVDERHCLVPFLPDVMELIFYFIFDSFGERVARPFI
mmetsp:Transcript_2630/g.4844  ORF Transcript_2630/g.4844 Transcript_2630/m.4844 type:complete len:89 (+) Transcript_2630:1116-1382(+)